MLKKVGSTRIQNDQEEGEPLLDSVPYDLSPPPDRYNLSYLAMVVFGLAALLPWNMFITGTQQLLRKVIITSSLG